MRSLTFLTRHDEAVCLVLAFPGKQELICANNVACPSRLLRKAGHALDVLRFAMLAVKEGMTEHRENKLQIDV